MDFAFTFQIPAGANVTFTNTTNVVQKGRYRYFCNEYQEIILLKYMDEGLRITFSQNMLKVPYYTVFFEKHKDGRLHIHGVISETTEKDLRNLRSHLNWSLGYKYDNQKLLVFKPCPNSGWDAYCRKEQFDPCDAEDDNTNDDDICITKDIFRH